MKDVSIDLDYLSRTYFYFDEPVDYKLDNYTIQIFPINVKYSEIFLSSVGLLSIDKNSLPSVEIIQMSYLQFIIDVLLHNSNGDTMQQFINLLSLSLHMKDPRIIRNNFGSPILIEGDDEYRINGQQFEDIRRIILYQNLIHFDDSYINPELKQSIAEVDNLKNKNLIIPSLERKIAIITAHTGLSKSSQIEMSYRSHSLLFAEVCGEVEFTTVRPVALFGGEDNKIEHWIYKKEKNKLSEYITSVEKYTQSMGSNQNAIKSSIAQTGQTYVNQFNNFNKS